MYKQAPSRSHRSKAIKGKHILQFSVLLAVCLWLIYQVKHSHEQKKEFEAKDEKFGEKIRIDDEIERLGRKDFPRVTEIATDVEKHGEEEDDKEPEEEENDHAGNEENEGGSEENTAENEEHERELDENQTENGEDDDVTKDHPESEENENAETEDNEDVRKEEHDENDDATSEDWDHEGERTTDEALEQLYKGDDASSQVAQNVQESENVTAGHENTLWGNINFGHQNETRTFHEDDVKKNKTISNATVTEQEKYESNSAEDQPQNATNSTENVMTSNGGSLSFSNTKSASTHETNGSNGLSAWEDNASLDREQSENSRTDETSKYQSSDEGTETVLHDPIDESDTVIDTLPDIRTEVQNTDEAEAE